MGAGRPVGRGAVRHERVVPEGSSAGSVAVRLLGFKRVTLWNVDVPLADIVAASASILPFTRPHKIGKRRLHRRRAPQPRRRPTSRRRRTLQLLFVPYAFKSQGFLGRSGARKIRKEPPKWEARTGGKTIVVQCRPRRCAPCRRGCASSATSPTPGRSTTSPSPSARSWRPRSGSEHAAVVARLDRRIAVEAPEIPLVPPLAERLAEGEHRGDALPVNEYAQATKGVADVEHEGRAGDADQGWCRPAALERGQAPTQLGLMAVLCEIRTRERM